MWKALNSKERITTLFCEWGSYGRCKQEGVDKECGMRHCSVNRDLEG